MTLFRTFLLALLLSAGVVTFAQTEQAARATAPPDTTVTVSISARGIRFAAPGGVGQMRLEVFDAGGASRYNSEFQAGNVRDWALEDHLGQPLPDGTYLCVVTTRDVSGRLGMRQGTVLVEGGQASLKLGGGEQIGAVEPEKVLAPVADGNAAAVTVTAHDGKDGQVVSTRGGLTFRVGDFFAGQDRELARLTPDGNLGVGVAQPAARLDVAGLIRTSEGIVFPDGTIQTTAGGAARARLTGPANPTGSAIRELLLPGRAVQAGQEIQGPNQVNISGSGTTNRVIKWTDGPNGVVGDSTISEVAGDIGVGTATPGGVLDVQRASTGDILQRLWNTGTGGAKLRYVAATGATSQLQLTDGVEWLMAIAGNNSIGMQFRVRNTTDTNSEAALAAAARMTILRNGNVGIGTTSPQAKLDVAGDLNVTGNIAAKYQDVAEWVPARQPLAAGTVVSLDVTRPNAVAPSARAYDSRIAGVVSSQPGVILGEGGAGKVLVATTGRVKVRVDASRHPIRIGDLLVTSNRSGVAMRSRPVRVGSTLIHRPGTIIGKALEPLARGQGEILVLLSLQ
ncbi:MAG TPA: hypothetical protein VFD58_36905 [Blastocatellia bacterium]|nr:hypothetical protein [Blastocatellia bacterium]